jgi:nitroreductase
MLFVSQESKMQKWEYCLVQLTYPDTRKEKVGKVSVRIKDVLEEYEIDNEPAFFNTFVKLGEDGWEAVDSTSHFGFIQYIFKRPKQEMMRTIEETSALEISPALAHELKERVKELQDKILEGHTKGG